MKEERWDKVELNRVLDEIIFSQPTWTIGDWAVGSGLSTSTCRRLLYRVTERPQFRSIVRMAYAAGYNLGVKVSKQRKAA